MSNPYKIVDEFEKTVAEYAGAKYGIAVDSCTNAIMLSVKYRIMTGSDKEFRIPKYTYVGVPYSILNAGGKVRFIDYPWKGAYVIDHSIIDSARRFFKNMYVHNTLYCLSFHWYKHLPVGRGGMILTDSKKEADILKKMRYDGRTAHVHRRS